jgi:hypothetical protein
MGDEQVPYSDVGFAARCRGSASAARWWTRMRSATVAARRRHGTGGLFARGTPEEVANDPQQFPRTLEEEPTFMNFPHRFQISPRFTSRSSQPGDCRGRERAQERGTGTQGLSERSMRLAGYAPLCLPGGAIVAGLLAAPPRRRGTASLPVFTTSEPHAPDSVPRAILRAGVAAAVRCRRWCWPRPGSSGRTAGPIGPVAAVGEA